LSFCGKAAHEANGLRASNARPYKAPCKNIPQGYFCKKKLFPKREKSKSHTQSGDGKEHSAVIFKDRNKTHHPASSKITSSIPPRNFPKNSSQKS
jgi:hypothetical protein